MKQKTGQIALRNQGLIRHTINRITPRALSTAVGAKLGQRAANRTNQTCACAVSNFRTRTPYEQHISRVGKGSSAQFSFACPAAAFSTAATKNRNEPGSKVVWPGALASAESDFTAKADVGLVEQMMEGEENKIQEDNAKQALVDYVMGSSFRRDAMANSLSFAVAESDFTSPHVTSLLDEQMKSQIQASKGQLLHRDELVTYDTRRELESTEKVEHAQEEEEEHHSVTELYAAMDPVALPKSMEEAMRPSDQATVITEGTAPFRIVDVNDAWVGLCGYTAEESRGKTLGELLQGPETDVNAASTLMDELLRGEESGTVLTNYTKSGRKFQNRIRVGQLHDEGTVTHFVGVLQEISEMGDHFTESVTKAMQA